MKIYYLIIMIMLIFCSCQKKTSKRTVATPPIAIAGNDTVIVLPTDSVLLDGSKSYDPDGKIAQWQWTKISGPASSAIISPSTAITKVRNLATGAYLFELKVTDNRGLSAKDTVQITVNAVTPVNHPPVANAGNDTTITLPANTANLDGNKSTDPENNITGYLWTKISGPSSPNITNANVAQTQVPNLIEGVYQFELKVTDAGGLFSKDTMQVTVYPQASTSSVDIYVAGWEYNGAGITVAKYWKNGSAVNLSDGSKYAFATSIAVSGSDIYVAGYEGPEVKYWKNGTPFILSPSQYGFAYSITVSGTDVYVAGKLGVRDAVYWKNGNPVILNNIDSASAFSITVSGNDVYVAGTDFSNFRQTGLIWKNGTETKLTDGSYNSHAKAVTIAGTDVYVTGYQYIILWDYYASYWKNGNLVKLSSDYSEGNSIAVSENNVYVAGLTRNGTNPNSIAVYWKNGIQVNLTDGLNSASANAIFIVKQ